MRDRQQKLSLIDMDVGLFVSYEMTAEALTTKLFRVFTLHTIPLRHVQDFREANLADITRLNHLNWFSFLRSRRVARPVYTARAADHKPRVFMRLDRGTHIDMKRTIGQRHENQDHR